MKVKFDRRDLPALINAIQMVADNLQERSEDEGAVEKYYSSSQLFTYSEVKALRKLLSEIKLSDAIYGALSSV